MWGMQAKLQHRIDATRNNRPSFAARRSRRRGLVQMYLMFSCIEIMTADQPHKFLRMHLMAVRANSILL